MSNIMRHASEGGIFGATARRVLSAKVWQGIPIEHLRNGEGGYLFEDDFDTYTASDRWTLTQASAGTLARDATQKYGVALLDCNSTTVTQGVQMQASSAGFMLTSGGLIVFEAAIALADIATGPEFLAGLYEVDTTLIATSALAEEGIGFKSETDNNVLLATCKNTAGETTGTGATITAASYDKDTVAEGAWFRLGIRIEGTEKAKFYVNGVKKSEIALNLPASTLLLVPSFVCQSGGTTDPILHIDWVKAAYRE